MEFSELNNLSPEKVEEVRRKGSVVIRNVVDDSEASSWKDWLKEYVSTNPNIEGQYKCRTHHVALVLTPMRVGFPVDDKQFFQL